VSPTSSESWRSGQVRQEAVAALSVLGCQVGFEVRGKDGLVHGEVVGALGSRGHASVRPWGLDGVVCRVRPEDVARIQVVSATREEFLRASHENARLAASGRFAAEAAR
jgi:hypothetical protein